MKCSDCGKEIKPVVAIDIDGTLADYHGHLLKFADQYLQRWPKGPDYVGDRSFREWFCEAYGIASDVWYDIKLAYRQGGLKRSQPIFVGAHDVIGTARAFGAEVWLTTTRPYLRVDNIDPDTRFWLQRNGIEYDGLLYHEDKYQKLAELVDPARVVTVLDDLPEQYDSAEAVFGRNVPLLMRGRYNSAVHRRNMAYDYKGAANAIQRRLSAWREETDRADVPGPV